MHFTSWTEPQNSLIFTPLPYLWRFLVEVVQTSRLWYPWGWTLWKAAQDRWCAWLTADQKLTPGSRGGYHVAFAIQVLHFLEHRGGFRLTFSVTCLFVVSASDTWAAQGGTNSEQWRPCGIWREEVTLEPVMSHPDYRVNLRPLGTPRGSKRKMESTLATGNKTGMEAQGRS